jgi:hypothetical protein
MLSATLYCPMSSKIPLRVLTWILGLALSMTACVPAWAAPYELRIYSDDIPGQGDSEVELIMGVAQPKLGPDSPHGRVVQTLFEYGYGLGNGWSVGLELPVSRVQGRDKMEGLKAELQYVAEHNKHEGWYWGVRGDIGYNSSPYELQGSNTMEINPILGFRGSTWHLIVNPSIERPLSGRESKTQFQPAAKISRRVTDTRHFGFEYFSKWGALSAVLPQRQRDESLYLVWDEQLSTSRLNLGLGKPLNPNGGSADRWVVKVGLNIDVD